MTHLIRTLLLATILLGGTAAAQQGVERLQHTALAGGGSGEMVRIEASGAELLFPIEGQEAARVGGF